MTDMTANAPCRLRSCERACRSFVGFALADRLPASATLAGAERSAPPSSA